MLLYSYLDIDELSTRDYTSSKMLRNSACRFVYMKPEENLVTVRRLLRKMYFNLFSCVTRKFSGNTIRKINVLIMVWIKAEIGNRDRRRCRK